MARPNGRDAQDVAAEQTARRLLGRRVPHGTTPRRASLSSHRVSRHTTARSAACSAPTPRRPSPTGRTGARSALSATRWSPSGYPAAH
eukprot:2988499-Prymnesium_polylepis.1